LAPWSIEFVVRDALTGEVLPRLAVPLTLTYQLSGDDLALLGEQPAGVNIATWQASTWQALPCST
jgi:hypothetical protein